MGGYRFNGCGVTDHFKTIKNLGIHSCPNCKKLSEFTLDEANQKIDIFWIPTLTLKSRYAVMCKKCKNGEFCSTEWAGYLINQTTGQDIIFESEAKTKGWSAVTRSFQEALPQQPVTEQPAAAGNGDVTNFFKCAYCGVTQMREGGFCAYCGKPVSEPEPPKQEAPPEEGIIICTNCGNRQEKGGKFCFKCGQKLTEEQPVEKSCPYCGAIVKDGMLFCMECGTRLT